MNMYRRIVLVGSGANLILFLYNRENKYFIQNLKSNPKLSVCMLSVVTSIIIVSRLCIHYYNLSLYPESIEKFLGKYYTVSTYIDMPNDVKELNELKESYRDCLVEQEIERFVCNRAILLNSLAAEQEGCTLKPKRINITSVNNERQTYRYEITVEANYTKNEQKDIILTGKVYMEDDSKYSLISKYYPDGEKQEIFNLLK